MNEWGRQIAAASPRRTSRDWLSTSLHGWSCHICSGWVVRIAFIHHRRQAKNIYSALWLVALLACCMFRSLLHDACVGACVGPSSASHIHNIMSEQNYSIGPCRLLAHDDTYMFPSPNFLYKMIGTRDCLVCNDIRRVDLNETTTRLKKCPNGMQPSWCYRQTMMLPANTKSGMCVTCFHHQPPLCSHLFVVLSYSESVARSLFCFMISLFGMWHSALTVVVCCLLSSTQ